MPIVLEGKYWQVQTWTATGSFWRIPYLKKLPSDIYFRISIFVRLGGSSGWPCTAAIHHQEAKLSFWRIRPKTLHKCFTPPDIRAIMSWRCRCRSFGEKILYRWYLLASIEIPSVEQNEECGDNTGFLFSSIGLNAGRDYLTSLYEQNYFLPLPTSSVYDSVADAQTVDKFCLWLLCRNHCCIQRSASKYSDTVKDIQHLSHSQIYRQSAGNMSQVTSTKFKKL